MANISNDNDVTDCLFDSDIEVSDLSPDNNNFNNSKIQRLFNSKTI